MRRLVVLNRSYVDSNKGFAGVSQGYAYFDRNDASADATICRAVP
jgi:hypothetical protein